MTTSDDLPPVPGPASGPASPARPDDPAADDATPNGPSDPGPSGYGPSPGDPGPAASAFNQIRSWGLTRRTEDSWIGGVASGLAARSGIDPILMRGLFVLLVLFSGVGLLAYGALWMILPQSDGRIHLQEAVKGAFSAGFFGALAVLVLAVPIDLASPTPGHSGAGPLLLIAVILWGLWMITRRHDHVSPPGQTTAPDSAATASTASAALSDTSWPTTSTQTTTQTAYAPPPAVPFNPSAPPRPRTGWSPLVIGMAILAGAAATLIPGTLEVKNTSGILDQAPVLAASAALAVIALGIVGSGLMGRRSGILAPMGWPLAFALILLIGVTTPTIPTLTRNGIPTTADMIWQPTGPDPEPQQLTAGDVALDLTSPDLSGNTKASLTVGTVTVIVPSDRTIELTTKNGLGSVQISAAANGGEAVQMEGTKLRQTHTLSHPEDAKQPPLHATVEVGVGEIIVKSATEGATP